MRYWISAQSPPLEGSSDQKFDRLWLAAGREAAGLELEPRDLVLVYQSRSGRPVRRREADGTEGWVRTVAGRQGIAAVVSVQVENEEDCLATIAHASVRRAMLELEMGRRLGQSRMFIVAYSVPQEMRRLCASYGVECFAVDRDLVLSWEGHRSSAGPGC